MKQSDLLQAFRPFRRLGVTWRLWAKDETKDGQHVATYGIDVSMALAGSIAVRTIRETDDCDPEAIVASMRKELASRAKATRAAIRREREPS